MDLVTYGGPSGQTFVTQKVAIEGVSQSLRGKRLFELVYNMRIKKPVVGYGIPSVVYQTAMESNQMFRVLLSTTGVSLARDVEISTSVRRQIFHILSDFWNAGYLVDYPVTRGSPRNVLEMFLVDSRTRLIQFIDFSRIRDHAGASSDLYMMLANVATDLIRIPGPDMDHMSLIEEVFEDNVDYTSSYFSAIGVQTPMTDEIHDRHQERRLPAHDLVDKATSSSAAGGDAPQGLPIEWGARDVVPLSNTEFGALYGARFNAAASTLRILKGIVLVVSNCEISDASFAAVTTLTGKYSEDSGIAKVARLTKREPCGYFVVWDVDPDTWVPLQSEQGTPDYGKISKRVSRVLEVAHSMKVKFSTGLALVAKNLPKCIFRNIETDHVLFLDFGVLKFDDQASAGMLLTETQAVSRALSKMFPATTGSGGTPSRVRWAPDISRPTDKNRPKPISTPANPSGLDETSPTQQQPEVLDRSQPKSILVPSDPTTTASTTPTPCKTQPIDSPLPRPILGPANPTTVAPTTASRPETQPIDTTRLEPILVPANPTGEGSTRPTSQQIEPTHMNLIIGAGNSGNTNPPFGKEKKSIGVQTYRTGAWTRDEDEALLRALLSGIRSDDLTLLSHFVISRDPPQVEKRLRSNEFVAKLCERKSNDVQCSHWPVKLWTASELHELENAINMVGSYSEYERLQSFLKHRTIQSIRGKVERLLREGRIRQTEGKFLIEREDIEL